MATLHASAVLIGAHAVLVRGPSGSGKSRFVQAALRAARTGEIAFARLVADDRTELEAAHGRLLARPPAALAGLLEIRGLGLLRLPYEPMAQVTLVVDLVTAADSEAEQHPVARLPEPEDKVTTLLGLRLPRLRAATALDAFAQVLARPYVTTDSSGGTV